MNRRTLLRNLGAGAGGALVTLARPGVALASARVWMPPPAVAANEELAARLAAAIEKHDVPGASAAVYRDGRLATAAVGVANVETGVPLTTDTVMHIGSITKVINATLLMQLVDEGRVSLDAPLKRYLPDFRVADPDATERITVRMLVNHTSGIDGEITPDAGHDRERIVDALPRIARMGQIHAPGEDFSYCNAGTVLAGYLAQHLTGSSWYDLVRERIFRPLGMNHAIVVPEDALLHRASVGHFLQPGSATAESGPQSRGRAKLVRTSFAFLPLSFAPAGATAMMSAPDLVTFARMHLNDGVGPDGRRILSAASARLMRDRTASYKGVGFGGMGLGWILSDGGIVTHGGGGPGILSGLYAHPASQTAIAVLTNAAHGSLVVNEIASPILEAVANIEPLGAATARLVAQASDAPVDPSPFVGQYESIATVVRVVPHGDGIAQTSRARFAYYDTTVTSESDPIPLRPIGEGRFALGSGVVAFVNPDARGRPRHLASGGRLLKRVS